MNLEILRSQRTRPLMPKDRLYVVAESRAQLEIFLVKNKLPLYVAERVTSAERLFGIHFTYPLILLDGWQNLPEAEQICDVWLANRGNNTLLKVSEPSALGRKPLCEHDTDGDGNCHLCVHKGGCLWPNNRPE